ncbi:MAG: aminotransferase [Gammaproteobacteria bacterium]|nr:aminotransferase [Gammaproteobacteria bacterium]
MIETETYDLQQKDNQFIHPWEELHQLDQNTRTVITSGQGVYIKDSDGNQLLDAPAGMWCVNIGHHRQEMADAISEQVMKLTYSSPWSLTNSPAAILARKLSQLSPGDLNHVFFATCGSTAVDSALRFVMFRNSALGKPEKKHIISRKNAYHGSTYLSASASGKWSDKINLEYKDDTFHHISDPNLLSKPEGMSDAEYCNQLATELEQKILETGADNVAAFIAEPVLASGGVLLAPEGYHAACLEVCRKHDVVYISDEVVTAFGRLGHFFASEKVFNIIPDIITCAKGITSGYVPLGAFLVSDRLLSTLAEKSPDSVFSNGFTYSGHPVACAAALKNIEIMERESILEHVMEMEPYFQQKLKELNDLPAVRDVRGVGLMACIECMDYSKDGELLADSYELANRIDQNCQSLGLLVRPIYNMCVMSPPLIINRDQVDDMVCMLRRGIELTLSELG